MSSGNGKPKRKPGEAIVRLSHIPDAELIASLSRKYRVPAIDLGAFEIDPEVIGIVPAKLARMHRVVPVNRAGELLIVAMSDPSNIDAIDDLTVHTKLSIEIVVASEDAIAAALHRYYPRSG
jgi:type IV pilus assembly protein PilB